MLKVKHLQCTRNHQMLFRGLTFSLKPGSCLQVYGRNGVGKSSLLRILAGLHKPCFGELEWNGTVVKFREFLSRAPEYQKHFIYIGHGLGLKMDLTPIENLRWWLGLRGISVYNRNNNNNKNNENSKVSLQGIIQVLQTLGLERWQDAKTSCLSAGLVKRLALARLKILPAHLWILDEPCNSLDAETQHWFGDLLQDHLNFGGIAVISSHPNKNLEKNVMTQVLHLGYAQENENRWEMS